jgi:hypothetical protein
MAASKVQGVRRATAKEIRELSKLPWTRPELPSLPKGKDVRILPDGRVLELWADKVGVLFTSLQVFEEIEQIAKGPVDLTLTLLPPSEEFIRDVEAHAASLAERLRIPPEALDRSVDSLHAVDAKLKRMRRAKRLTPEIVTPLVAYVGMVMLGPCGGHWIPTPKTIKRSVPEYDPAEWAAWEEAQRVLYKVAQGTADEAKARGASATEANMIFHTVMYQARGHEPKPVRHKWIEEPYTGSKHEPFIKARDGRELQPCAIVIMPMIEPSEAIPLHAAVGIHLLPYRPLKKDG